jgi:peptide/nickel transport system permease protein
VLTYITKRLAVSLVTLWGVTVVVFGLVQLLPGDPARVIAGVLASQAEVDRIRTQMGLDEPVPVQYALFVSRLAQGDLGISARTRRPVAREVGVRLPRTLQLAAVATLVGSAVGIWLGVVAARRRGTWVDHILSVVSVAGVSMPVYWLGLLLMILFAVNLGWVPAAGADRPTSIVLPSVTLAAFSVALIARMTRSSMLEVLEADYVRTARSKGVVERTVVYKHALRNGFIPVLTVIGIQFGTLLGGAVLTESVFAWPGIGRLLVDSIFARDFPMVQGIIVVYALLFIVVNLIVDILYAFVNPRIQY